MKNGFKQYSEKELEQKYNEFIEFVKTHFTGDRQTKLLDLYSEDKYGIRLMMAPASPLEHFHSAYMGGYMDHVMNVCKSIVGVKKLWEVMNGTIDFTDDEMFFAALHHDLGKLGIRTKDMDEEYYLDEKEPWQQQKRGAFFKMNPRLQYMDVADRALFILQENGITYTWKEQLGIKLADGLYAEGNEKYYKTFYKGAILKTNLPYITHMADALSCHCEFDQWKSYMGEDWIKTTD